MTKDDKIKAVLNIILDKGKHISYSSGATPSVIFNTNGGCSELAKAIVDAIGLDKREIQRSLYKYTEVLPVNMLVDIRENISQSKDIISIRTKNET